MTAPTARILLVRHGPPQIEPGQDPSLWRLSDAGREAVTLLARVPVWTEASRVFASPEPKARETAEILARETIPVTILPTLREALCPMPFMPDPEDFRRSVMAYVDGAPVPCAEPLSDVAVRWAESLAAMAPEPGETVIAVSHGRAMSIWLAQLQGGRASDVWRTLRLPDWRVVMV